MTVKQKLELVGEIGEKTKVSTDSGAINTSSVAQNEAGYNAELAKWTSLGMDTYNQYTVLRATTGSSTNKMLMSEA